MLCSANRPNTCTHPTDAHRAEDTPSTAGAVHTCSPYQATDKLALTSSRPRLEQFVDSAGAKPPRLPCGRTAL